VQIHDPEKASEKKSITEHIPSVIGAFIALTTLVIVLATLDYDENIIIVLLFIITVVLIIGFFGNLIKQKITSYSQKKEQDKFAKHHFEDFKKLVLRFEKFADPYKINIRRAVVETKRNHDTFSKIHIPDFTFFENFYVQHKVHLNQFNGTKVSLIALAMEFANILGMYNKLYIYEPIEEIRDIGSDEVQRDYKREYNQCRDEYIDFLRSYKNFADDANKDFKANDFRGYFDIPDEF